MLLRIFNSILVATIAFNLTGCAITSNLKGLGKGNDASVSSTDSFVRYAMDVYGVNGKPTIEASAEQVDKDNNDALKAAAKI